MQQLQVHFSCLLCRLLQARQVCRQMLGAISCMVMLVSHMLFACRAT